MADRAELKKRLEFRKAALDAARTAYIALLTGQAQSYTIGSRNIQKFQLPQLKEEIDGLEKEIDGLEAQLNGGGRRKAVGVVPRDW